MATAASYAADALGYYAILGVAPDASQDEIRRAFRRQARRWHPDCNGSPDAAERMAKLNEAYDALGDPKKRAAYDRGAFARTTAAPEPPRPAVRPATVDFGALHPDDRATRTVIVRNLGGPCGTVRVDPDSGPWFRLAGARGGSSPDVVAELDFEAFVDPAADLLGGRHERKVRVLLDDEADEVTLSVRVIPQWMGRLWFASARSAPSAGGSNATPTDPLRSTGLVASAPRVTRFGAWATRTPLRDRLCLAFVTGVLDPVGLIFFALRHAPGSLGAFGLAAALLVALTACSAAGTRVWTRIDAASPGGQFLAAAVLFLGKGSIAIGLAALVGLVLIGLLVALLSVALVVIVFAALAGAARSR